MVPIGIRITVLCIIGAFSGTIFGICGPIENGVADFIAQPGYRMHDLEQYTRQKRICPYFGERPKWKKEVLTWHFYPRNLPSNVTESDMRSIIKKALQMWSKPSGLRFCEVSSNADIKISFEQPDHSAMSIACDLFEKSDVAHSFGPENSIFEGHLHINSQKTFSTNGEPGTYDIFQVILHELGHIIGLRDSESDVNPRPVMAGYETGIFNITLKKEDIDKVKELYKELQDNPRSRHRFQFKFTPENPFTPSFCRRLGPIDAAFEAENSTVYILHGNTYTEFDWDEPISEGLIRDKWKEVEIPVDAAYADLDKNQIVFIKV